jgi:hypothetical protein
MALARASKIEVAAPSTCEPPDSGVYATKQSAELRAEGDPQTARRHTRHADPEVSPRSGGTHPPAQLEPAITNADLMVLL